jgi:hypothetical protein
MIGSRRLTPLPVDQHLLIANLQTHVAIESICGTHPGSSRLVIALSTGVTTRLTPQ